MEGKLQPNIEAPSQTETDYFDTTNETSQYSGEMKRGNKVTETQNQGRNRLTFGPKQKLYSRKQTEYDQKNPKRGGAGAGDGSILSFKNFAVLSRADSIRNSHKKNKARIQQKKMTLEVLSTSQVSDNSGKGQMVMTLNEDQKRQLTKGESVEKYNVYKEVKQKKDSFNKRNSVIHSIETVDFDKDTERLTSSLIQNSDSKRRDKSGSKVIKRKKKVKKGKIGRS
jgi:hypothetical protein